MKTVAFFFFLVKTSICASITVRGAFLIESCLMILNNLIFFVIWWIFFRHFQSIDGWTMREMAALLAIGTGAYGVMQLFFGGVRTLARTILNGDLDPLMTQPKNLLLHIVGSKSISKGWGNLLTVIAILFLEGFHSFHELTMILLGITCGALVFASIAVLAHSLAFWLGPIEALSRKYCDSLFLFALYPTNIYSGALQLIMFTVLPAGIISYLPVELLRCFCPLYLLLLLGATSAFVTAAFWVFSLGIKRYESGNQFNTKP